MLKLEPLTGHHNRNGFDCQVEALNLWLKQTAMQHHGKGISRTFVAVPENEAVAGGYRRAGYADVGRDTIVGFYSLSAALVVTEELPSQLVKRYPRQIPVTRLGRLAIRADMQGQGLGRLLLADAVNRSQAAAQAVGSAGMVVDAKDGAAAAFYAKFGFQAFDGQPLKLYLSLW
jgi:GNAT superfamily N-acetyltransferase